MNTLHISTEESVFEYILSQPISNANSLAIRNIKIPNTYYNIETASNIFSYEVSGTPYTHTIPRGNYNVVSLLDEIKTGIDTELGSNGISITYSAVTGKTTFATSTALETLKVVSNNLAKKLGFSFTTTASATLTGDKVINLESSSVFIILDNLVVQSEYNGDRYNILYKNNMSIPPFGINDDENDSETPLALNPPASISTLRFRIVNEDIQPIDFNGGKVEFSIIITHF